MNKLDAFAAQAAWPSLSDRMALNESIVALAHEWEADPEARSRADETLRGLFSERGIEVPGEVELRVVENSRGVHHMVMPPDPNAALADEALSGVSGGNCVGSAGTASSVGSLISTLSTGGTASSASTGD